MINMFALLNELIVGIMILDLQPSMPNVVSVMCFYIITYDLDRPRSESYLITQHAKLAHHMYSH